MLKEIFFALCVVAAAASASGELVTRTHDLIVPDDLEKFLRECRVHTFLRTGRISNGQPAVSDQQFPFVGDVTVRWREGNPTPCTAALIATNWIVTARRCIVNDVLGQIGASLVVQFGSASRAAPRVSSAGDFAAWKDSVPGAHPDFALFRLRTPMTLSLTINTIQLPSQAQVDEWFQRATVNIAGWGAIDGAGTPATTLKFADFINTTPFECTPEIVSGINEHHFCSEPNIINPASIQNGDFGAPVFLFEAGPGLPPTLIGVASTTGFSFVLLSNIMANTRLGPFLQFISQTTGIQIRPI